MAEKGLGDDEARGDRKSCCEPEGFTSLEIQHLQHFLSLEHRTKSQHVNI